MARPACVILPSSILVVLLLLHFHVADSSRPLSTEDRQRPSADRPTSPAAAVVHRAETHHHRDAAETGNGRAAVETTKTEDDGSSTTARAEEGGAAAAALSATTTTSAVRGKDDGQDDDGVGSRNGRPVAAVLLYSRSARRFLAGGVVEGADSAAKPSCRSSDVNIGCTPPSEH